ncbi:CDF family Co(II)/Ni(II) efflux transporter DmeF [Hydrogenophaga crocea]|uniref:CDF family Co(II)/Ni(II) efflux transporter DmeF n=1 Tax=Hydrogenophaga crocea TaxID=2716225 RepID=A0A6G8IMI6_9BURK|nr:CDF family Co(II)/Ni(II) efflux transporter DmeF [Hydrogenophaga crocea]QIM54245.1 CDF family Co(II)/Ni(II) efflux transporter DmeF [Hydrogenophaga crocea]
MNTVSSTAAPFTAPHTHHFLGADHARNERRVWWVIALTASMMLVEIVAGTVFSSMALVADGWHMATHAGALLITALAYRYARRHADDPRFSFGTGKFGDLAGFASAVVLALVAVLIAYESFVRLVRPVPIGFEQALAVAVVGLLVNLLSAWLLKDDHGHHHHGHGHGHGHAHHHDHDHGDHAPAHDNNLRAAYIHVLADALTSVLAIVALLLGRSQGWLWADPLMGVVGALVIARWAWGLIRAAGRVLLDAPVEAADLRDEIREALAATGDTVLDLHVWQLGPGHFAAIVSIGSANPQTPATYKALLAPVHELSHVTVEVVSASPSTAGAASDPGG